MTDWFQKGIEDAMSGECNNHPMNPDYGMGYDSVSWNIEKRDQYPEPEFSQEYYVPEFEKERIEMSNLHEEMKGTVDKIFADPNRKGNTSNGGPIDLAIASREACRIRFRKAIDSEMKRIIEAYDDALEYIDRKQIEREKVSVKDED